MAFHSPSPSPTHRLNLHPSAGPTTRNKTNLAIIIFILTVLFFFFVLLYTNSALPEQIYPRRRRFSSPRRRFPLIPLDACIVEALPVFEYKAQSSKGVLECAICLSEFQENEKVRFLPHCEHSIHVDCIDMWFRSHSTCPTCRTDIEPKQRVIEISALAQDSPKGTQALMKRKQKSKSLFTSGMSSTPETAIGLPSRSESFTTETALHSLKIMLNRGVEGFPVSFRRSGYRNRGAGTTYTAAKPNFHATPFSTVLFFLFLN